MGFKGRRYAEDHLSLDKCASLYEQLLGRLINKKA
jgi:hypothetical protein